MTEPTTYTVPVEFLRDVIALCTQRGYSPEDIEAWSKDDKWVADLWRQAEQMLAIAKWGQPAKSDPAYSAACHLATALFKKHFAHLPDFASGQAAWGLCDSTAGVISQIDNMVSGLVQPPTASPQEDSVQEDAARYRWLREGNDAKHGAAWHVAVNLYGCEWDAAIDAARKQGEKQ